ncbi:MAG: tRNA (guanosine(46)-N7)-methyltransferase TrmB [Pseudomonadales bacterium]
MGSLSSVVTRKRPDGTRSVRSYIRRQGRITRAQARAREQYWSEFGIELRSARLDVTQLFCRTAPLVVEIGFGMGRCLLELAERHPECNFIGIDVYRAGVGALLDGVHRKGLDNVRVFEADAIDVLEHGFRPATVAKLLVYFPDPWPKKRHHKRRLVKRSFLDLAASRLEPRGQLLIATDWAPYAVEMLDVLKAHPLFANAGGADGFAARPAQRPLTRFEERGIRLGHAVYDLVFERQ